MGDPKQTDLEEFLASEVAGAAPQLSASLGSAGVVLPLVQHERSTSIQQLKRGINCVQIEHKETAFLFESAGRDAEPSAAVIPMSPHRLLVCLAVIGWSERKLARRTGRLQTMARRWTGGQSPVPADVAGWVETLADFHRAHLSPRAGQGLPE